MSRRPLLLAVADLDAEVAVTTLLAERQRSLGIRLDFDPRPIGRGGDVLRVNGHDPACRLRASDLLRPALASHAHALLLFDLDGSGPPGEGRERVEAELEADLVRNGWPEGDAAVVVMEPELEAWCWARSPEVAAALGWPADAEGLRSHLDGRGLWPVGEAKPPDPKAALEEALRVSQRRHTAQVFGDLARVIGLRRCEDAAFRKLCERLRGWFPAGGRSTA